MKNPMMMMMMNISKTHNVHFYLGIIVIYYSLTSHLLLMFGTAKTKLGMTSYVDLYLQIRRFFFQAKSRFFFFSKKTYVVVLIRSASARRF